MPGHELTFVTLPSWQPAPPGRRRTWPNHEPRTTNERAVSEDGAKRRITKPHPRPAGGLSLMGGHVRMDKDLEDEPRVLYLTEKLLEHWTSLGVPKVLGDSLREGARNAALGGLYRLWRYADTHLKRGDLLNLPLPALAAVTGWPVSVLRQFPQSWLMEHPDGNVQLPDYSDKNALQVKDNRREKTRLRVAAWRRRQREDGNALPKRIGNTDERHSSVTTGTGSGTGTGTNPPTRDRTRPESENRELPAPAGGELASAQGRLARRDGPNGAAAAKAALRPTKSPEQLDHDIGHLADQGLSSEDIARVLAQYGVTALQVRERLANRPPEGGA